MHVRNLWPLNRPVSSGHKIKTKLYNCDTINNFQLITILFTIYLRIRVENMQI